MKLSTQRLKYKCNRWGTSFSMTSFIDANSFPEQFPNDILSLTKYDKTFRSNSTKRFAMNPFLIRQSEGMARPAEARARRPADRTHRPWRKRGWADPEAAWIPDRAAPVRIEDRRAGVAVSCTVAAATVPASNGYEYRVTATPCDPARR